MESFLHSALHFHGNGKHHSNWQQLKEVFSHHSSVVEQAALSKRQNNQTGQTTTLLLQHAQDVSTSLRASLIVVLMLVYQMEFLGEDSVADFVSATSHLFDYISPQEAVCASAELAKLSHKVTELTCENKCPAKVIPSLSRLSRSAAPSPTCLTAIHGDILQACISGKFYAFAHDFISETTILEISPKNCFLDTSDYLKYFYYSGIVYISMKKFDKALESFNIVLSTPAEVLSQIFIDAYKKAVLVSLIHAGDAFNIPSDAVSIVKMIASSINVLKLEAYELIQNKFLDDSLTMSFLDEDAVSSTFIADANMGLAKQAVDALKNHRVAKVAKAYMSISLEELASLVGPECAQEEVERRLIQLNKSGCIVSKIDMSTGHVKFLDPSSRFRDSAAFIAGMKQQLEGAIYLSNTLRDMYKEVLLSKKHLKKAISNIGADERGSGMSILEAAGHEMLDQGVDFDMDMEF